MSIIHVMNMAAITARFSIHFHIFNVFKAQIQKQCFLHIKYSARNPLIGIETYVETHEWP